MRKDKQTAIRLDLNTHDWLEQEAQRTGKPVSVLIREGIELLMAETRLLRNLMAQFEASGVTYPSMKTQTATGVKQATLKSIDVNQSP